MNKIIKILVAVVVILLAIVGIFGGNKKSDVTKIGIVGHFSGEYASYGVPMKNGMELAFVQLDPKGEKFKLIVEDDGADPAKAATAVNKLISVDKVDFILSAQGSGATSAIIPITESNKKILMITLASAPDLLKDTNYVFRSVPSDIYQGKKMADYINTVLKSGKVSGLYANDPYGLGIKSLIETNMGPRNGDSEIFSSGSIDFRTNLLKIKNSGADTVVVVARENEYPLILRQIKELGIKANLVASETFKDDKILSNSVGSAEGVVTFMAKPVDYVNFASEYKNKFGIDPSAYSMYGYDGAVALISATENAGNDIESVRKVLFKIDEKGASGNVSFDSSGDRTGVDYSVFKVEGGKFVEIK